MGLFRRKKTKKVRRPMPPPHEVTAAQRRELLAKFRQQAQLKRKQKTFFDQYEHASAALFEAQKAKQDFLATNKDDFVHLQEEFVKARLDRADLENRLGEIDDKIEMLGDKKYRWRDVFRFGAVRSGSMMKKEMERLSRQKTGVMDELVQKELELEEMRTEFENKYDHEENRLQQEIDARKERLSELDEAGKRQVPALQKALLKNYRQAWTKALTQIAKTEPPGTLNDWSNFRSILELRIPIVDRPRTLVRLNVLLRHMFEVLETGLMGEAERVREIVANTTIKPMPKAPPK
jgi:DNA repair exonuclease SbcCD ATPase subunit